jgi:hypothetical protein
MLWALVGCALAGDTVRQAFPPPDGYSRLEIADAFGAHVRELPLLPASAPVLAHDGRTLPGHAARVIDLPMVPGDLQQCADSLLRVRAEWLEAQGLPVTFHATSGDEMPWARWQAGERPYEVGGKLQWKPGTSGGWESYLARVFTWAGTRSLQYDTVPADAPRPGDLLVAPGSPGHAVLLLDVARRDGPGGEELVVLVGEGFMPAQSFHVELGPLSGWWPYRDGVTLPHWDLPASGLRRF